jgi:hypothetical protein
LTLQFELSSLTLPCDSIVIREVRNEGKQRP